MRWCPEASWSIWRLNSRQRKPQFRGGSLALYFEKNSLLSCIQWEHFGNTVIPGLIHLNARVQKTSSGVSVSFTGWFMMRTVSCGAGARAWALWARDVRDVAGDHILQQGRGHGPPPPGLVPLLWHPWSFQMRRLLHERANEMSWTGINVQRSVLWEHRLQPHPLLYRCSGGAALSTDSSWGIPFLRTVVIG